MSRDKTSLKRRSKLKRLLPLKWRPQSLNNAAKNSMLQMPLFSITLTPRFYMESLWSWEKQILRRLRESLIQLFTFQMFASAIFIPTVASSHQEKHRSSRVPIIRCVSVFLREHPHIGRQLTKCRLLSIVCSSKDKLKSASSINHPPYA